MTLKDDIELKNTSLAEYEDKHGLTPIIPPGDKEELQEYLDMDKTHIESLSKRSAIAISIRLAQYAFYINRLTNKHKSMMTWINHKMEKIIAGEINQYDSYKKYDINVALIAKNNSAAAELNVMKLHVQQIIDRLDNVSNGIKNISYVISLITKLDEKNE